MLRTAAKSNRKAGGKYTYARLAHDTGSARARFAHNPRRRGGPEREKASRNPPATMCGKTAAPSFKIQKTREFRRKRPTPNGLYNVSTERVEKLLEESGKSIKATPEAEDSQKRPELQQG